MQTEQFIHLYKSPIGTIEIRSEASHIISVKFVDQPAESKSPKSALLEQYIQELNEYFQGRRKIFSVPYQLAGTDFQIKAWESLGTIPFGETRSYQEQATAIHNPKAVRAIGRANGQNRLLILIPCHRVIGKSGNLVGFGAEVWRKKWLLDHERKQFETS